jgi:hypothetical protein
MHRHAAHTTPVTLFVPFSVEISGAWGGLLGASTRRRWLTLTTYGTRSTSNTFTGAAHASQPFGGKPSQSARPASGAELVWRLSTTAFKGDWARRIQAFELLEFPGSGVAANK